MTHVVSPRAAATPAGTTSELVRTFPHLLRWQAVAAAGLLSVVVLTWTQSEIDGSAFAVWVLRIVIVSMVMGILFLLDDASANITDASVFPLWRRIGLRLLLGVVSVGAAGLAAGLVVGQRAAIGISVVGLTVEAAALVALGSAIALWLQRRRGIAEPGQFAAIGVLFCLLAAHLIGVRWPMLVGPGPDWADAHWRWLGLIAVSLVVILFCLRDPAARPVRATRVAE